MNKDKQTEERESRCAGQDKRDSGDSKYNRWNGKVRREALQAAVFVLLFFAILWPVSYMVRTNGDVKDRFAGFYAEKKDSLDVVMIGSSPVFPYYAAPKLWGETGIAMYPLSTNVQRPAAMRYRRR